MYAILVGVFINVYIDMGVLMHARVCCTRIRVSCKCMYYICLGVCLNTCMCMVGCSYEFKYMVMCYSDPDPFRRSELSNRRPRT